MDFHIFLCLLTRIVFLSVIRSALHHRSIPFFSNQFAVHIRSGADVASRVAEKYGFHNHGQIGSLKNYYLFEHKQLHKRSKYTSDHHHNLLDQETEVVWFQQQHERRRYKRDSEATSSNPRKRASFFYTHDSKISSSAHDLGRSREIAPQNTFTDPLFKEQWYLNGGAKDGFDMNLEPAWRKGYTGKRVVVSILDDGIQTNHPDLAQNYDHEASTDINDNDDDPMPRDNGDNKHGTRCAGEVAAVAFNSYCGVGVAFNSSIGGVRMLDGPVNDAVEARALGLNPDHIDIYSASWGPEDDGKTVDGPGPLARRAFIYGVTSGRQGRGSIFVWASGNGGRHTDSCNCDGYTNSIFTLSISSATQGGYKPWYLEECSSTLASTYSSGTPGNDKSVTTVDMDASLREDHICTVEHTGTSASAPLAAGIVALALEANPSLTWRDMQYLVVLTSRSKPLEKESGWITNGVKRKVSHKFGYGLMDAGAIVSLAEQWTNVPSQRICKSQEINEDRQIDPTSGYTLEVQMDVNGCMGSLNEVRFLEHVQCKISLRFFPRGNLRLQLTSPMGTTTTLLFERPRDVLNSNFDDWPFLSVHFWGEETEGRWILQVINAGNRHVNSPGILKKWQLIFYGTATNPIKIRSQQRNPSQHLREFKQSPLLKPLNHEEWIQQEGYNPSASAPDSSNAEFFSPIDFRDYPVSYVGSASFVKTSMVPFDRFLGSLMTNQLPGESADSASRNNGSSVHSIRVISFDDCDSECDDHGCFSRGPSGCVHCRNYQSSGKCVSKCPIQTYPNSDGLCWLCHGSCQTCMSAGPDSCASCSPGHFRVVDLAICMQRCPEGYHENAEDRICLPCGANCASCLDQPDRCTSCERHLVLYENRCHADCPPYTYETPDYQCLPCHSSCESCNGTGENSCIACRSGLFSHQGRCRSRCPRGYSADKKRRDCMQCPIGCKVCTANNCSNCELGWTLDGNGVCLPDSRFRCNGSKFFENGQCKPCDVTCDSCFGPSRDSCISCKSPLVSQARRCISHCEHGHYPEVTSSGSICIPCSHTCNSCASRLKCTSCLHGLKLQGGECRTTCPHGYYSDRDECIRCYLSCKTCTGPNRDQCISCPKGWQLLSGECHPECPKGYFKTTYGCQKCHHRCSSCQGEGPSECTSCQPPLVFDNGICKNCTESQYYDRLSDQCKRCHPDCQKCSGPERFHCSTCLSPMYLDTATGHCTPCCVYDHGNDVIRNDTDCFFCNQGVDPVIDV